MPGMKKKDDKKMAKAPGYMMGGMAKKPDMAKKKMAGGGMAKKSGYSKGGMAAKKKK